MASAMGVLGWSPAEFRNATFYEFTAAMKGHLVSNGVEVEAPMTRTEFLALKREADKREKARASGNRQ